MVERAAEETSEPEDAAFAHGSLGRLAPAWWEPAEGEPEPEPWLSPTRRSTASSTGRRRAA